MRSNSPTSYSSQLKRLKLAGMLACGLVAQFLLSPSDCSAVELDAITTTTGTAWIPSGTGAGSQWSVTNGRLVIHGPATLTKTIPVSLTTYRSLKMKTSQVNNNLYNLTVTCGAGVGSVQQFIRTDRNAEKGDTIAPHLTGSQSVTLAIIVATGGHCEFDYLRFTSDDLSGMPAPALKDGVTELGIPFDQNECSRWDLIGNIGVKSEPTADGRGRLIFFSTGTTTGGGQAQRTFTVDVNAYPTLLVFMSAALPIPSTGVTNLSTNVSGQGPVEFLRTAPARPDIKKALIPLGAAPAGKRKVTIHIYIPTGKQFEYSAISFLAPPQEVNAATGWAAAGGATYSVNGSGHMVVTGPGSLTRSSQINLTTYPTLSASASAANAIFDLQHTISGATASFLKSNKVSQRSAAIVAPAAGLKDTTLKLVLNAGGSFVFDRMKFTSDTSATSTPEPEFYYGKERVKIPLDVAEVTRWQYAPEAAGDNLQISAQNRRLIFDGKGTARRVFWVDLEQFPNLRANMVVSSGSPVPSFNLGTSVGDAARVQFLQSTDGPKMAEGAVPGAGTGPGKRKVTVDIVFSGGHHELSELDFVSPVNTFNLITPSLTEWQWEGSPIGTRTTDANGRMIATGPGTLKRTISVNMTDYPALSAKVSAANGKIFNMNVAFGSEASSVFLRSDQPIERECALVPPGAGFKTITIRIVLGTGGSYTFDHIRLIANASSTEIPAAVSIDGRMQIQIPFDKKEASRWHITNVAADGHDLRSVYENGRITFTGRGTAERTFFIDPAKYPVLFAHMSHASIGDTFNLGNIIGAGDTHVQFLRSENGPSSKTGVIPITNYSLGTRRITVTIYFTGPGSKSFGLSDLTFLAPMAPPGPPPPTEAAQLQPPSQAGPTDLQRASYLSASGAGAIGLAVWKENGALAGAWRLADNRKIMEYSGDIYRFLPQSSLNPEQKAYETQDEVTSTQSSASSLVFTCTNPAMLGVTITKTYSKHATAPNVIVKRVQFAGTAAWANGLFYWESVVNLDPSVRYGGIYNNTDYHPARDPFFEADQLVTEIPRPYRQQVVFYNRTMDLTVAHHRMMIDDKPVGQQANIPEHEKDRVHFTPKGWRFFALADRLGAGKEPSATVHYTVVPGDMTAYHRLFQTLDEYVAGNTIPSFSQWGWVNEVKGVTPPPANLGATWDTLDEGYGVLTLINAMDISDYPLSGTWTTFGGSTMTLSGLNDITNDLRARAPKCKFGIYTIYWGVYQNSAVFNAHKDDWFVRLRGADYQPANLKYEIDPNNFTMRLMTPEHLTTMNNHTTNILQTLDCDYFYLDGGSFGGTQVDWPTMRVIQPVDSFIPMAKNASTTVMKNNVPIPYPGWVNAANGLYGWNNPMGYYEGFLDSITLSDWRALSVKLMEVKLYQRPGTWVMPVQTFDADIVRYSNHCLSLGLKGSLTIDLKNLPLINMLYELHPMLLQNVGLRPRWYVEPSNSFNGNLETYALGFDTRQLVIPMLNHQQTTQSYPVSFDPAKTQMDPAKETYVFRIRPEPTTTFLRNKLTEPQDREMYGSTGWAPIALSARSAAQVSTLAAAANQSVSVRPNHTEHMVVTQTPGLIWSTNKHRKYFPLSQTRWGGVQGERVGNVITLQAACAPPIVSGDYEVAAIVPADWSKVSVNVDGQAVEHRRALPDLVIVPVSIGGTPPATRQIVVTKQTNPAVGFTASNIQVNVTGTANAGQTLAVNVTFPAAAVATKAYLNLSRDCTPVYTSQPIVIDAGATGFTHQLVLPSTLQPDDYIVRVAVEGATGTPIAVAQKVTPVAMTYPADWDDVLQTTTSNGNTYASGRGFNFKVLRTFVQKSPLSSYWVDVSPGEARLKVGSGVSHVAGFAYGAIENDSLVDVGSTGGLYAFDRLNFGAEPGAHLSFSVDYHTASGYAKRVYFNGTPNSGTMDNGPTWGIYAPGEAASTVVTQNIDYQSRFLTNSGLTWLLAQYAPKDAAGNSTWTGKVILGANIYKVAPETEINLNLDPLSLYSANNHIDPALLGDGFVFGKGTYYPVTSPLALSPGTGNTAVFNSTATFCFFHAHAWEGVSHAFSSLLCINTASISLRPTIAATGESVLVADYIIGTAGAKRVIYVLSSNAPDSGNWEALQARVRARIQGLDWFKNIQSNIVIKDYRAAVAAQPVGGVEFAFGIDAPSGWIGDPSVGNILLHAGALGPEAEVKLEILNMDSFVRY